MAAGLLVSLFGADADVGAGLGGLRRVTVGCLPGFFGADDEMGFGLAWAAGVLFAWGLLLGVVLGCGWVWIGLLLRCVVLGGAW